MSSNYLSSKPVLRCLQSMPGVPLAEELVHLQPPQASPYGEGAIAQVRACLHCAGACA